MLSLYNLALDRTEPEKHGNELHVSVARHPDDSYPGGGTWRDAWRRTLLHDHYWGLASNHRVTNRHISALVLAECPNDPRHEDTEIFAQYHLSQHLGLCKTLFTGTDKTFDQLLIETIHRHCHWQTEDQKLFMTEKGYIGIANQDILEQDRVFILPGSREPIVLRAFPSAVEGEATLYSNFGIMDGEATKSSDNMLEKIIIV